MRRLHGSASAVLVLAALVPGAARPVCDDEPGPPPGRPPWQRLLQGRDARTAADAEKQLHELVAAGRLAEALPVAASLAELRARGQGADHWQAANAREQAEVLRRVLRQDDSGRKAYAVLPALRARADELIARRRFREAQPLLDAMLATRRQVLGDDHPATAISYGCAAANLVAQEHYAAAAPLFQKALDIFRQALGDDHPDTAGGYNNLAFYHHAQEHYAAAAPLFQKALDIRRRTLGDGHPDTATSFNNLAANLSAQHQYAAAEPLLRHALAVRRRVLGETHPLTAQTLSNVAANLAAQGQYAAASPLLRQALDIHRRVFGDDHPETAASCGSLAKNLQDRGRNAEAGSLFQKALDIRRQALGDDHPTTAAGYNSLAHNLHAQGQYAAAEPLFLKALDILRRHRGEDHPDTATACNNVAANLDEQGQHAAAEPLYLKALQIRRRALGEDHLDTAQSYNNLATYLDSQDRHAAAAPLHEKALAVRRRVLGDDHPLTAQSCNNAAVNLGARGQSAAAEPLLVQALDTLRRHLGENHPDVAGAARNLAVNQVARGRYVEAEATLTRAARSFATARASLADTGRGRAGFTSERSPLPLLAVVRARNGRPVPAWQAYEDSLAPGTREDLAARRRSPGDRAREADLLAHLRRLDEQIEHTSAAADAPAARPGREALLALRRQGLDELTALRARLHHSDGPAGGGVLDRAAIQAALSADAALVGWLDFPHEHWAVVLRSAGEPSWVRLPGRGPGGAWTDDDTALPARLRAALVSPGSGWQGSAAELRAQRLAPLANALAAGAGRPAVRRLVVLPSSALAGLPLDVLAEGDTVSYAPSGTLYAHLCGPARSDAVGLLALADPVFDRPREPRPADPQRVGPRPPAADGTWPPLPGTRAEAETLHRLAGDRPFHLLTGSQASEQELDRLAKDGTLARQRYLHFATHGTADPRAPLCSAVILARDRLPDPLTQLEKGLPFYDGRLTAEEVLERWTLDADLVTLSACETALGKHERGEGFVGFAQAFLLAGSRSVCLSLWKVDDTATALLMTRFYENLLGRREDLKGPLPKAEASREAKAWLRDLPAAEADRLKAQLQRNELASTRGTVEPLKKPAAEGQPVPAAERPYAHPYYWSAFILVGGPG